MMSGTVVFGVTGDVVAGMKAVVVSLVVVFVLAVTAAVGAAVAVVLVGAQVVGPGRLVGWLLGG